MIEFNGFIISDRNPKFNLMVSEEIVRNQAPG